MHRLMRWLALVQSGIAPIAQIVEGPSTIEHNLYASDYPCHVPFVRLSQL